MQYQQLMLHSTVCAAIFNAQRMKKSDKFWTWKDFHPEHKSDRPASISGDDVNSRITATYAASPGIELEIDPDWKR